MIARMTGVQDVARALERFRRDAMDGMREGVTDALNRFQVEYKSGHLQMRKKDSVGVRDGTLLKSLSTEVKSVSGGTLGRVYFKGGKKIQTIAKTLEYGATIRPKKGTRIKTKGGYRRIPYLRFQVFRKWSRGGWNHPKPSKWVTVKQTVIPPYLNFYPSWKRYLPTAFRILGKARDKAVAKARPMFS